MPDQRNAQTPYTFALGGGLDMVTPAIQVAPGRCLFAVNYEAVVNGYGRVGGYERYDGHIAPSAATYGLINFTAGNQALAVGTTVTGGTSGATGKVLVPGVVTAGSYGGSDAVGYLILSPITGTFVAGEALRVGGVTKATSTTGALDRGGLTDADDATFYQAAIEAARLLIGPVPGSGPVRGVWCFDGNRYAVRDDAGGTAGVLHKATAAGWVAQPLGRRLYFTAGLIELLEGQIINGATSGATATITRVVRTSGSWGSTAAGYVVFASQVGTFTAETLRVGATPYATIAGNSVANALPAGGRYRFKTHNFYGAASLERVYGVNGVGPAFEWDGAVFCPIYTGMTTDAPTHIAVHKNQLMLGFRGGSVQISGPGDPTAWQVVLGAAEITIGDDITALIDDYLGTTVIFGRNKVAILYGNDPTDFDLKTISADTGAIEWTGQKIGMPLYFDDAGLRKINAAQEYGNFRMGTVSDDARPFLDQKKKGGVTPIASLRVRAKDQYRLFYDDGTGFSVYLGKKAPECMTFDYGKVARCVCSSEGQAGDEVLLMGCDDGFVYQLDSGTSFDGQEVNAAVRLPFATIGSPARNKRYHKATVELDANANAVIGLTAEFSYSDASQPPSTTQTFAIQGGGGFWNEAFWNQFFWSAAVRGKAEAHIDGAGNNVSITIISTATYEEVHVLQAVTINYSFRGLVR